MARNRSLVSGLYPTKPGCVSIAILTPRSAANAACLVQYGDTTSSHCHLRTSRYSGGQGHVTQLGCFDAGESPGQPEKSITTGTFNFAASSTVLRLTSASCFARAAS